MKRALYLLLFSLFLINGRVYSQNKIAAADSNITLLGYLPIGNCEAVTVFDTHFAAIGSGRGVRIMDTSDPSYPVMVSEVTTGGEVSDVYVSGNYLYFTTKGSGYYVSEDFSAGLTIVDISDPAHPGVEAFYQTSDQCYAVTVNGNYAYVSSVGELLILNVSDPQNPTEASSRYLGNTVAGMYCDGQYLYAAIQSGGVKIYNLGDPVNPGLVGTISDNFGGSVSVQDTVAAVAGDLSRIALYSVLDPANPVKLVEIPTEENDTYYSAAIHGQYLYISGTHYDNATRFMFKIYDISDPRSPQFKSMVYDTKGKSSGFDQGIDIAVQGNYAFVANNDGFRAVQIADPSNSGLTGRYLTLYQPQDVQVQDNYAYFIYRMESAGLTGFSVVNVSDPSCLHETGYVYLKPSLSNMAAVALTNGRAYLAVADFASDSSNGLRIVDVSNLANPQQTNFIPLSRDTKDVIAAIGNYIYLQSANLDTIHVFDVSDPDNPVSVGYYTYNTWTVGYASSYYVDENYLYVGTTKGLMILDRTNPANLGYTSFYELPGGYYNVTGVAIEQNRAYLATGNGLVVVDISDPANPATLAFNTVNSYDVDLIDDDIFIASPSEGVLLYNQVNDTTLEKNGYYNTKNYNAHRLTTENGFIYAAYEGLMIFRKGTSTGFKENKKPVARSFKLFQNYPNPFNPITHIRFSLSKPDRVKIAVYNTAGQLVELLLDAPKAAGNHEIEWNAERFASGLYLIRLQAGNEVQTGKAVLVK